MSNNENQVSQPAGPAVGAQGIQRLGARSADIGGALRVNRLLPQIGRRRIGAWCFLDHAGPASFAAGGGMRVGPHPHIGLQTFTWMIEGEVLHRDSLGNVQVVRPGQVNLMTAGHGIAHTEESLPGENRLHAVQLWIALPFGDRDCAPAFEHHPVLPRWSRDGCEFTLLAGSCGGHAAPVKVHSPLVGLDVLATRKGTTVLDLDTRFEHGILVVQGQVLIEGQRFEANELACLGPGRASLALQVNAGTRLIVLGGEPFTDEIVVWWNFVGHGRQEVAQAHCDWQNQDARFGTVQGYDGPPLAAPELPWRAQ